MTTFRMIHPDSAEHLLPIAQLAADVFTGGKFVDQFCQHYIGNSHYDWNASRVILDGEQMVHHWGVWGYPMRLESLQLKVAGVGAVATHGGYRKQGLMHRAAQASFAAMAQDGYDLSILRGRHYAKMGYGRAWNYVTYRIKLEDLPGVGLYQPYRSLGIEQVGAMDAFYNHTHAAFTGTAVRPTYRNRHADDLGVYAWFEGQDRLAGYIRALPAEDDPKVMQCLEAAGDPYQGLAVLSEVFKNSGCQSLVCFTLPHHHPLLQLLRRGACIVEDRYFDVSGWRVRFINLAGTLQKLIPLLENRLAQSCFANWQGSLLLDGGEQRASLHIEGGKVAVTGGLAGGEAAANVLRGGADLARLLIGSDEPDEIIRQADMDCSSPVYPLVQVLFPNLRPMMSHWDEY